MACQQGKGDRRGRVDGRAWAPGGRGSNRDVAGRQQGGNREATGAREAKGTREGEGGEVAGVEGTGD